VAEMDYAAIRAAAWWWWQVSDRGSDGSRMRFSIGPTQATLPYSLMRTISRARKEVPGCQRVGSAVYAGFET
jgi:hypothetical protein